MYRNFRTTSAVWFMLTLSITTIVEGATTFYPLHTPVAPEWIESVTVDSSGTIYAIESRTLVNSDGTISDEQRPDTLNRLFYSNDQGNSWHPIQPYRSGSQMVSGDFDFGGPVINSHGDAFMMGYTGGDSAFIFSVFRSSDKGQSWKNVLPNLACDGADYFEVNSLDYLFLNCANSKSNACGYFYTKNYGTSWARFDSACNYDFSPINVFQDLKFEISKNGVTLFNSAFSECKDELDGTCIQWAHNTKTKYIRGDSIYTFNETIIGKIHSVVSDKNGVLYIGTDSCAIYSRDDGRHWSILTNGNISAIYVGRSNQLYVEKKGEGVYKKYLDSLDDTLAWSYIGLKDSSFWSICDDNQGNLYFVTRSGLYSTAKPTPVTTKDFPAPESSIKFYDRKILVETSSPLWTSIALFDLSGKRIAVLYNGLLYAHKNSFIIPRTITRGIYLVRYLTNGRNTTKLVHLL